MHNMQTKKIHMYTTPSYLKYDYVYMSGSTLSTVDLMTIFLYFNSLKNTNVTLPLTILQFIPFFLLHEKWR